MIGSSCNKIVKNVFKIINEFFPSIKVNIIEILLLIRTLVDKYL